MNYWKINYKVSGETYQVVCMRKSYAASVIRSLIKRGITRDVITVMGPKEEIEAYERAMAIAAE